MIMDLLASPAQFKQNMHNLLKRPLTWVLLLPILIVIWLILHFWAFVGWWLALILSILIAVIKRLSLKRLLLLVVLFYGAFIGSVLFIVVEHQLLHVSLYGQRNSLLASTHQSRDVGRDQTVSVDLVVKDFNQSVNLVQLDLKYDPKIIELIKIDYSHSFAKIFIQEIIDNKLGFARVVVAAPNPGLQSSEALMGTAIFRAQQAGLTMISILPSSKVLANDGKATNIFKQQQGIAIFVNDFTVSTAQSAQSNTQSPPASNTISLLIDDELLPNPIVFTSDSETGLRATVLTKIELLDSIILERFSFQRNKI